MTPRIKNLVMITLLVKAGMLILICAGYYLVPFSIDGHDANFVYPFGEMVTTWSALKTWDANHYLYLADFWYSPYHISNAFYPLLPFLIRLSGYLTFHNTLVAGLIISTMFTVLSVVYLYLLTSKIYDEEVAFKTCLFLLAFPTAFFIGLVYTESVFLMLSVMFFYYMRDNKTVPASVCSFLLPLTRPAGILLIVPAFFALVQRTHAKGRFSPKELLLPAGFLVGFAVYLLIMTFFTGDPFAGFDAQKVFLASNSLLNMLHPVDWFVKNFVSIEFTLNGFTTSILNRAFFVIYAVIAVLSCKKMDKTLYVYMLMIGLVPAMSGSLTSYMRYVVVVFPMYIYLAMKFRKGMAYYLIPSSIAQVVFLLIHTSNRWVA